MTSRAPRREILPAAETVVGARHAATEASSGFPRAERYELVEAARGLACLMVLLYHSLIAHAPETLTPALRAVAGVTVHGWIGVHVFFAISGWCVAERFALARTRHESGSPFLLDRALRIFPAYWAAVLVTLALRLAAAPFNSTRLADNLPAGPAGWLGTGLLLDPYLGTPAYLIVSWSLVYELGFYACMAVALGAARWLRLGDRVLFASGALLCALPWTIGTNAWFVLGLWPNFFAGVAAWVAVRTHARFAGVAVLLALTAASVAMPGRDTAGQLAAIGTATALGLLHRWDRALAGHALVRPLVWLGLMSYSLYLMHVPFNTAWQNLAARAIAPSSPLFVVVWLGAVAVAIAAGWAMATWIELPLQRWRKRTRRSDTR